MSRRSKLTRSINIAFQTLLVAAVFLPFYFLIISSLKTNPQILERYFTPTFPLQFDNYVRAFSRVAFYLRNSIVVCGTAVVGVMVLSSVTSYIFARKDFPGKRFLFLLILSFLMIPGVLTLVPQFVLVVRLKLVGTYWAAILPYIAFGQILAVFILRTFIEGIPRDLFDSAVIDGARDIGCFIHVAAPLSKAIIASLALLNFHANWNDFVWPLLVLPREHLKTVTVGLYAFTDVQQIQYGVLFAGFVIASVPLVVLFSATMKHFIRGIQSGAIKA